MAITANYGEDLFEMILRKLGVASAIFVVGAMMSVWAETPPADAVEVPFAAPEPPPRVKSGESLEPEVVVRPGSDGSTLTEYRINGRLEAIKVEGQAGAYWLIDPDGDGKFERRRANFDPEFLIPGWVLFRW